MVIYEEVRQDFEFLETIAELRDQFELDRQREWLMKNPTKAVAAQIYRQAIELWFRENCGIKGLEEIEAKYL